MDANRDGSWELTLEGGPFDGRTVRIEAESSAVRVGPVYEQVDESDPSLMHTYGWHRVRGRLQVQPGRKHVLIYGGTFSRRRPMR